LKYRDAARHLKEKKTSSDVANFFLSPRHYPDLVMSILIEREKNARKQSAHAPKAPKAPPPAAAARGSSIHTPKRRPAFHQAAKSMVALVMLLFLSCAVAPHAVVSGNLSASAGALPFRPPKEVEPAQSVKQAAMQVGWSIITDSPLSRKIKDSFVLKLLRRDWAGLALIDGQGKVQAIARKDFFDEVSEWMASYKSLQDENYLLERSIQAIQDVRDSKKIYLEIDLAEDLVYVKMGTQTLYKFPIVSGMGYRPRAHGRQGRFATPRGILTVKKKERNPVWRPPGWHWRERGAEVPERLPAIRGVLGRYRLNLGNAYGIHGTRSGRIGRPGKRSHGCIRMNRRDLETVYKLSDIGTEVYIY